MKQEVTACRGKKNNYLKHRRRWTTNDDDDNDVTEGILIEVKKDTFFLFAIENGCIVEKLTQIGTPGK